MLFIYGRYQIIFHRFLMFLIKIPQLFHSFSNLHKIGQLCIHYLLFKYYLHHDAWILYQGLISNIAKNFQIILDLYRDLL